ncbi:MAG TPA: DUF881 domain-containing protein [Egibacteraceae bacterium]|nr:DUF881 domain-containing protein [Egibacteraceae bacterium]
MTNLAKASGLADQPAHDYPLGPPTRWSRPWSPPVVSALTAIGALLVGFFLVAGLSAGRTSALEQDARKAELIALINARSEHTEQLSARLEDLRARVAEAEADVAAGAPSLSAYLTQVEQAAGLTRLTGPGLRVTFADAVTGCSVREEDCRIQDRDLQLAVNALFGAGAEAVAVNGERIIATTALRRAGRQILVNYRVLTPPYVVEAIGNPDRLAVDFARSEIAEQFAIWTEVYGLGFATEVVDTLDLAPYGGSVQLRAAEPVGDVPGLQVAEDQP